VETEVPGDMRADANSPHVTRRTALLTTFSRQMKRPQLTWRKPGPPTEVESVCFRNVTTGSLNPTPLHCFRTKKRPQGEEPGAMKFNHACL
jgi:hypothetical protein